MKVAVWNYYEEITKDGYLFNNIEATIGAELLSAWNRIYVHGASMGIDFYTLDQIDDFNSVDAFVFMDHPRMDNELVVRAFQTSSSKYLITYECEVIKPDNWQIDTHKRYEKIFTWNDNYVDGKKYIKSNFTIPRRFLHSLENLTSAWKNRNFACMMNSPKAVDHPLELYSERIHIINHFENIAGDDFHLYGHGWDRFGLKCYQGSSANKLETLSKYKFCFAYENAKEIPGYITEKIFDCFRAGVVPIYKGAPNIHQWIPANCFVDANAFSSLEELINFLKHISDDAYQNYLQSISAYLNSKEFDVFSDDYFIKTLCGHLRSDFESSENGTSQNIVNGLSQDSLSAKLSDSALWSSNGPEGIPLVIYITYGPELSVFLRARALWQFYSSFFPDVEILFVKESPDLGPGEVVFDGYDLNIGLPKPPVQASDASRGYAKDGVWAPLENWRQINRQIAVYDYLLRTRNKPFHVYQSTVTSVVDLRVVRKLASGLPSERCYAGMPGKLESPNELKNLVFACGTNSIFSSDMLHLMRERYDPLSAQAMLPNDVWQAITLPDVGRIALPFFSFLKPRSIDTDMGAIVDITHRLLEMGHFHFRVKTSSGDDVPYIRENIDPWIMLKIMETIIGRESGDNIEKMHQLMAHTVRPLDSRNLPFKDVNSELFSSERIFPLTDNDYPD